MSVSILRKKIGKDDVIIMNEKLLPTKVKIKSMFIDNHFSKDKIYDVLGISWLMFADRSRALGYILIDDKSTMDIFITSWFEVVTDD